MAKLGSIWFFINLIVGAYFVNLGLNFIPLSFPDTISRGIMIAGGILVIIGGLISLTKNKRHNNRYYRR